MKFISVIPQVKETGACDQHGGYEYTYRQIGDKVMSYDSCPACGKIEFEKRQADELAEKNKQESERVYKLKISCGFSPRNVNVTFDDFQPSTPEQEKAKATAERYAEHVAEGGSGCLIMIGSVGTGKTMLATAIAAKMISARRKCCIARLSEMMRDFKDSWRKDSDRSESQVMDYYSNVGLLVLDEIGVQFDSDTEKMYIFEVIDGRYQNMKPTVLISNLDLAGVKASIGERVYDRLREDGGKVIAFDWPSMRGGNAN
jgi:DNA replication protein DnaC